METPFALDILIFLSTPDLPCWSLTAALISYLWLWGDGSLKLSFKCKDKGDEDR